MASLKPGVHWVFLVIGVGLLGGAGALYYFFTWLPQTWPRTEAEVVSSRVINPRGPNDYTPEIVFRYTAGDRVRERTIVANWTSSSYDMVRGYIDGYAAGSRVSVAVNPEDPDDVRHEIGATLVNVLVPGIVGTLGLIFTVVGFVAGRSGSGPRRPQRGEIGYEAARSADRAPSATFTRRFGAVFIGVGLVILAIAAFLWRNTADARTNWPAIDATVVASRVVPGRSSSRSGTSSPMYDTEVTFRYEINGTTHENTTQYGVSSSSRRTAESKMVKYAPGTSHVIRVRPDDPNIVRFDFDSPTSGFWLPLGLGLMSLIFIGVGTLVWRAKPQDPLTMPDVDMEDGFGDEANDPDEWDDSDDSDDSDDWDESEDADETEVTDEGDEGNKARERLE